MSQGIGFSQLTLQKKILVLMVGITLGVVSPTLYIVYTFTGKAITEITGQTNLPSLNAPPN